MQSIRILIAIGVLITSSLMGQKRLEPYNPTEYMDKGYALIDESEDYAKAELEFAKIHPNDTLYNKALYSRIVCYRESGKPHKAMELIEKSLALNDDFIISTYLNKVYCLDSLGKTEDAYAVLDEAEKRFPYNYDLKKARAPLYEAEGKYEEAFSIYKDCIRDEPLNPSHHISLASFALEAGGISHAVLPLAAALALNPEGENNLFLIKRANYIVSNKPEIDEPKFDLSLLEDDFEDIDDLVGNYIALDDSYKVPGVFQISFIKQLYLMITESEEGEGFYSSTYLAPFKSVVENNMFDEFAALLLLISEDAKHYEYVKENMENIGNVNVALRDIMDVSSEKRESPDGLTDQKVDYLFYGDGKINGFCQYLPEKDMLVGPALYINRFGSVSNTGAFDTNGKLTGEWTQYHTNGEVASVGSFVNGELDGKSTYYYDTGIISAIVNYKNGQPDGRIENYKLIGYKYEDVDYKGGQKQGKEVGYYPDQSIYYEYLYDNGKLNGPYKVFYEDGSTNNEGNFKNDLYEGEVVGYYRSGQIKSSYTYKEGVLNGPAVEYYEDGQVQSTGAYKNDKQLGEWKQYNSAGALIQVEAYDERGKVNGPTKNLDYLGRVETVYMKKKGEITELINYDTEGEVISKYKVKGGELKFKNLNVNGVPVSEGKFVNETRAGEWKNFDPYGGLANVSHYENGLKSGEEKNYILNEYLASSYNYKEGKREGLTIDYHPNGSFSRQANFKEDNLHGSYVTYNQDGVIISDLYFIENQLMGTCKYYNCDGTPYLIEEFDLGYPLEGKRYDPNGEVSASFKLINGTGVDKYYFYADQKQVMGSVEYKGGLKNGPSLRFHNNGKKRLVSSYVNDEINGDWENFYFNGNTKRKGQYAYGTPIGEWKNFYMDGTIMADYKYSYGRLDGTMINYYDNGEISDKQVLVKGYYQGTSEFFNYNGEPTINFTYENDVLVGYSYLDSEGKQKEMISLPNGTGTVEAFFPNGQISTKYKLKYGLVDGERLRYYSNGQLDKKDNFSKGSLHGKSIGYYDDGSLRFDKEYSYDELNGEQKFYYPGGKLKKTENWRYGEQHGMTTFYDENEKVTLTIRFIGDVPYDFK